MKIIKIILFISVIAISLYGLTTDDFSYSPLSALLLGCAFLIIGIEEMKKKGKKSWGYYFITFSVLFIVIALVTYII